MMRNKTTTIATIGLTIICTLLWPSDAHAYIGPAIVAISALFGPIAAVIVSILMVLYFPIKVLIRKRKKAAQSNNEAKDIETQDIEAKDDK